jgi:putative transposase
MARKRHSDEDILKLLREIELALASGHDVATACRSVGISDATYYNWRKRFGGMARSQLSEMKALEKESKRPAPQSPGRMVGNAKLPRTLTLHRALALEK